jgi:hypothetical protein
MTDDTRIMYGLSGGCSYGLSGGVVMSYARVKPRCDSACNAQRRSRRPLIGEIA